MYLDVIVAVYVTPEHLDRAGGIHTRVLTINPVNGVNDYLYDLKCEFQDDGYKVETFLNKMLWVRKDDEIVRVEHVPHRVSVNIEND